MCWLAEVCASQVSAGAPVLIGQTEVCRVANTMSDLTLHPSDAICAYLVLTRARGRCKWMSAFDKAAPETMEIIQIVAVRVPRFRRVFAVLGDR